MHETNLQITFNKAKVDVCAHSLTQVIAEGMAHPPPDSPSPQTG